MNRHYDKFEAEYIIASFLVSTWDKVDKSNELFLKNEIGGVAFKLPITNTFDV